VIARGRRFARRLRCPTRVIETRLADVREAMRAAARRRDFTALRTLAASPTIPLAVRSCKPIPARAPRGFMRARTRRPLTPRRPSHESNACFTGWPGGLNYYPPGQPLPTGWVRTAIIDGFATNRKCYPPKGDLLEKLEGGGSLPEAQRQARTAGAILKAQADDQARRARWREYFKLPLPKEALSLRAVEGTCGKRPGLWACFTRWPGGWLPFDHPDVVAHPDVWKGPTPYGVLTET